MPVTAPELRIDRAAMSGVLRAAEPGARNLLAFPAQSNYSGVRHRLDLVEEAHTAGWDVLGAEHMRQWSGCAEPVSYLDLRDRIRIEHGRLRRPSGSRSAWRPISLIPTGSCASCSDSWTGP